MANMDKRLTVSRKNDRIGTEHLDNEIGAIPSVQTVSRTTPNGCKLTLIFPPITLNAKWWVIIFIGIELVTGITGTQMGVAHFAHLGGALFGWLLIRYWQKKGQQYRSW